MGSGAAAEGNPRHGQGQGCGGSGYARGKCGWAGGGGAAGGRVCVWGDSVTGSGSSSSNNSDRRENDDDDDGDGQQQSDEFFLPFCRPVVANGDSPSCQARQQSKQNSRGHVHSLGKCG